MKNKGFTLIELVIYTAAFALIIVFLILFTFSLINSQARIKISKEVMDNSQRAMEIMIWEIKHAHGIYLPTSVFDANPGQLSLKSEYNTPDGEIETYIDFYLDENSRLCMKKESIDQIPLVSEKIKVDNLVFTNLSNQNTKSIRIELSATYLDPSNKYQATTTLTSSINLRND